MREEEKEIRERTVFMPYPTGKGIKLPQGFPLLFRQRYKISSTITEDNWQQARKRQEE